VVQARVIQINVLGLLGGQTDAGRNAAIDYVVNRVRAESPLMVSLNELCPTQALYLALALGPEYSSRYAIAATRDWRDANGSCRTGGRDANGNLQAGYGNLVLVRFSALGSTEHYYTASDSGSVPGRNLVCVRTGYGYLTFTGCSTHLSAPPAANQTAEWLYALTFQPSTVTFGAGDLNTSRASLGAGFGRNLHEADLTSPKQQTGDKGAAIDYIHGTARNTSVIYNQDVSGDLWFTDHRAITGYYLVYF
jgi:hypothetical protein